jgi:hypothetical protein
VRENQRCDYLRRQLETVVCLIRIRGQFTGRKAALLDGQEAGEVRIEREVVTLYHRRVPVRSSDPRRAHLHNVRTAFGCAVALLAALLGACVAVSPVGAAPKTTRPGQVYHIPVVLTDKSIKIGWDHGEPDTRSGRNGSRYPRGVTIDFRITNKGTHANAARLKLLGRHVFTKAEVAETVVSAGKPIEPGRLRHLVINFYYRSSFALQLMAGAKPLASAPILVY